ncbi:hypothetical protein [Pseudonocardia sp. TRM90224]|uniref:hypothetical protein n=1 Tax=Pseudonocardia sp. TRM90224 TaxID=2812678 RepID=UPI001E405139|nr:hypothetical protein [Pseudonocardia sp. TRM90224]
MTTSHTNTRSTAVTLGALTALLGVGGNAVLIVMGLARITSGQGPATDRSMAWLMVISALISLIGWVAATVTLNRRINRQPHSEALMAWGLKVALGLPFVSWLTVFVALGGGAGVTALVFAVVLGIAARRIVPKLGA